MKKLTTISGMPCLHSNRLSPMAFVLGCLILLSGCVSKDLEIDVSQKGCSLFEISSPTTEVLVDPSCTGDPLFASYNITFKYTGNEACLHRIVINGLTEISDSSGEEIQDAEYAMEFLDTSALVHIDRSAKKITFRFDIYFPDSASAKSFNAAYIKFHCENSEGLSSEAAKVHIIGNCGVPPGDIGEPVKTITVRDSIIRVKLWDNAEEDGDIISVYLNGVWVLQNFTLTNSPQTFNWPIHQGIPNDLTIVALNQGTVGPNTVSISINGRWSTSLDLDLQTGAIIRIL